MVHRSYAFATTLFLISAMFPRLAPAQGLTGQINGSVSDPQGATVAGARVTVLNVNLDQSREATTDAQGAFSFTELLPGTYSISVETSGFKRYEQRDIALGATERLALHQISLEIGQVSETMSVSATAARIQTESGERSGLVTTHQLQEISLKGRDYLGMTRLLPGVVDTANRESPGFNSLQGIDINGARQGTIDLNLDGVTNLDTGSGTGPFLSPSLDAVAEMKVLLTNYQAEYGRASGGTINVVTKNGTRDLHGSGYYFVRNDAFNANEYFNNLNHIARPVYRYNDRGYTVGGPVLIPKLFPRRDKLFFFWSQEYNPRYEPQSQQRRTFPTPLERQGNFSQTLDTNGKLISIIDPLTKQAFPGNMVPVSRIDKNGQGLLNVFPLPNATDPTHTYNYLFQNVVHHLWNEELLRLDYNYSSNTLFYIRLIQTPEAFQSAMDTNLGATNWPQFPTNYQLLGRGLVTTAIHTFNPTLVNEFTVGINRGVQDIMPLNAAALASNSRVALGLTLPQYYPQNNPLQLIPNSTFGGVSNAPALAIEARFPYSGTADIWDWSDNLSKVAGAHTLKAGVFIENASRNGNRTGTPFGQFDFSRDVNNPYDTNYAFSNALLGSVTSYSESTTRPYSHGRYQNYEWFGQDSWHVSRKLTLDLGLRFYVIVPSYNSGGQLSSFEPNLYSPSQAPTLIVPYKATPTSARVGLNPVTGQTVPAVLIGSYAPGTGSTTNGMLVANEQIAQTPPVQLAPRIGFAYDIFGDGKTALRGGFGIFPDRFGDTTTLQLVQQAPLNYTPTTYYTTISQLLGASGNLSPSTVNGIQTNFRPQTVYNFSLSIQRDIGFGTVLDVGYVGSLGRHLLQQRNLNAAPYGTNFLPSSQDPTNPGKPLPPNFLRPYIGYGDIVYNEFAGNSSYHSLQTQLNKRIGRNLTFGASWTWSKAMDTTEGGTVNPLIDPNIRNYGKAAFDRTHNLVINYVYAFPRFSEYWKNGLSRSLLDNWAISGVTSLISGPPLGLTYTFVQSVDITGTTGAGVDSRVVLTGNPILPKDERTPYKAFNTSVVQAPSLANFGIGNAPKDVFRGPGVNNWDLSLFKNFLFGNKENFRLQIRAEAYNIFNHTQFNGVDTAARFDYVTGAQTNTDFGAYSSAAQARRLQLGVKLYF